MKRTIKSLAKTLLPGPVLRRIRDCLFRTSLDEKFPAVNLEYLPNSIRCHIDDIPPFDLPNACKQELVEITSRNEYLSELYGIARLSKRGGQLFDVGAHAGIVSALFCAANPQNHTVCFEPSPSLCSRLEEIREIGNLQDRMLIEPIAIGAQSSEMTMLVDPIGGFVQSKRFDHSMWGEPTEITVSVETIPQCVERLGISPDFIKIDIEGYEFEAVQGAMDYLRERRPVLFFELHLDYLEQRHIAPRKVVQMLVDCGYSFYCYPGQVLRPQDLYDSLANVVRFYCE